MRDSPDATGDRCEECTRLETLGRDRREPGAALSAARSRRHGAFGVLLLAGALCLTGALADPALAQTRPTPPIASQVTFLYFEDLERATRFYGTTLGLQATLDLDWVKIFQLSPTSAVGLVDAENGVHRPSASKPVMLSLVVDDVDAWYAFLRERGVEIPTPPRDSAKVHVRSFGFRDPEGYTLEVFSWQER